jgi:glycosyltransferase involved in cell wall biosynthesis
MTHRVTVVVPVYDGARFLRQTLASLRMQTLRNVPIICIDDRSTDESAAIAESVGVKLLRNEQHLGLAANWNRAAQIAETCYLVIAHQDDIYEPTFLSKLTELLDIYPNAFMAHAQAKYIDETGRNIKPLGAEFKHTFWPRRYHYERGGIEELLMLVRGNYIICPATMFRREAMKRIGPFSSRWEFVTDWDYWIRGVGAGYTIAGVAEPLVRWRRHDATATSAYATSLLRFREEKDLLLEVGHLASAMGVPLRRSKQFGAVRRTLFEEFIKRLSSNDSAGARAVARFTRRTVPGAWIDSQAMHIASFGGAPFGRLLRAAAKRWLSLNAIKQKWPHPL